YSPRCNPAPWSLFVQGQTTAQNHHCAAAVDDDDDDETTSSLYHNHHPDRTAIAAARGWGGWGGTVSIRTIALFCLLKALEVCIEYIKFVLEWNHKEERADGGREVRPGLRRSADTGGNNMSLLYLTRWYIPILGGDRIGDRCDGRRYHDIEREALGR
ncbi:hypothetical protein ACHAXA_001899, partial [Cyclostephanos tholiformis]